MSMIVPIITIAIPTYNRPKALKNALISICNQKTDFFFEVIIHDNSCNDASEKIINKFKNLNIRYKRHIDNIGMAANWNSLLESAKTNYIKFLNDDDTLEPNCVDIFCKYIIKYPDLGIYTCRANYTDLNGNVIKLDKCIYADKKDYIIRQKFLSETSVQPIFNVKTPTHSLYRRDLALQLGGFNTELTYAIDIDLSVRLGILSGGLFIERLPLVNFVIHSTQMTQNIPIKTRILEQLFVRRHFFNQETDNKNTTKLHKEIAIRELLIQIKNCNLFTIKQAIQYIRENYLWDFSSLLRVTKKYSYATVKKSECIEIVFLQDTSQMAVLND